MYNAGFQASGVYLIRPKAGKQSFPVYCDQNTAVGGWIVIQKRFDGSVRFSDRKWVEYESGFGDLTGEFWLGLDKIHLLTKTPVRIRFDLGAPDGTNKFAAYQGFTIAGADQKYKLTTGTYIGKCTEACRCHSTSERRKFDILLKNIISLFFRIYYIHCCSRGS